MELAIEQMENRDEIELLIMVYRKEFVHSRPVIDQLYKFFIKVWEQDTVDYLESNREAFKLEDDDFENIEENLTAFGFQVPSFEDIYRWLDIMKICYFNESGEMVHSPLVNVW